MSDALVKCLLHIVFSTKNRTPIIADEISERLFAFIGGICRRKKCELIAAGGTEDHVHLLVILPATVTIADAVREIKGASSKWVNDTFPGKRFSWQVGYGAFSIGSSMIPTVVEYIHNQKEHHQKVSFQEELTELLEKYGITYDPRYLM